MEKKLRNILAALITIMTIATVIYANALVSAVYTHGDVIYAAHLYVSEPPAPIWNTSDLGIVKVIKLNGTTILIDVDLEKVLPELLPLQTKQPIFLCEQKYYKVSPLHETPELPSKAKGWEIPAGAGVVLGWSATGAVFFLQRRRKQE